LTVNNSTLCENSAGRGGAIYNSVVGTVTLRDSNLSGNAAGDFGAGIYNEVYGTLTVSGSTLSGNSATGGGIFDTTGGGIANFGTATVSNSTLSGNTATVFGGGIANFGTLTVRDSTLLGNSAPLGGDLYNAGAVSVFDSIIGDRYDI
jgi:hypothetical protein